jgi:hypothetical protein
MSVFSFGGLKMTRRKQKPAIHPSIKKALGYSADERDKDVLKDWRRRTTRVCKPCWELKYCPYGPLVEQSPLLPVEQSYAVEHHEYLEGALATGKVGGIKIIDDGERKVLARLLADEAMLLRRAFYRVRDELNIQTCAQSDDPIAAFLDTFGGNLPSLEVYRVPFELLSDASIDRASFDPEIQEKIDQAISEDKRRIEQALATGRHDQTRKLDEVRRAMFARECGAFDPEIYPDEIPQVFEEATCNIFGHICPVFFAAEALTETEEIRRRGRYIPFKTKIRVVRRDNYTCQH